MISREISEQLTRQCKNSMTSRSETVASIAHTSSDIKICGGPGQVAHLVRVSSLCAEVAGLVSGQGI